MVLLFRWPSLVILLVAIVGIPSSMVVPDSMHIRTASAHATTGLSTTCVPDQNTCLQYQGVVRRGRLEGWPDDAPLKEVAVLSVSTFAENNPPGDAVNGAARLRVWARSFEVARMYTFLLPARAEVTSVQFTLKPSDTAPGRELFTVMGSHPPDEAGGSTLPLVVYDILNFFQIPTNVISAFVNNLFVGPISSSGLGTNTMEKQSGRLLLMRWTSTCPKPFHMIKPMLPQRRIRMAQGYKHTFYIC